MEWAIWLSALFAGIGLAGAGVSYHTRLTFGALKERVGRLEKLLDDLPDRYARRDDVTAALEGVNTALKEIFAELRRANEGIAALRGEKGSE